MGEKKRREAKRTPHEKMCDELAAQLMDKGCLMEAGWVGLRKVWLSPETPATQIQEMRMAFMAGAQHLFSSIMTGLDSCREPTDRDLKKMDLIDDELRKFYDEFLLTLKTKGPMQ